MYFDTDSMQDEIKKAVAAELSKQFPGTIFTDEYLLSAYEGLSDSWAEVKDEAAGPWKLALTLMIFDLRVKIATKNNI